MNKYRMISESPFYTFIFLSKKYQLHLKHRMFSAAKPL